MQCKLCNFFFAFFHNFLALCTVAIALRLALGLAASLPQEVTCSAHQSCPLSKSSTRYFDTDWSNCLTGVGSRCFVGSSPFGQQLRSYDKLLPKRNRTLTHWLCLFLFVFLCMLSCNFFGLHESECRWPGVDPSLPRAHIKVDPGAARQTTLLLLLVRKCKPKLHRFVISPLAVVSKGTTYRQTKNEQTRVYTQVQRTLTALSQRKLVVCPLACCRRCKKAFPVGTSPDDLF